MKSNNRVRFALGECSLGSILVAISEKDVCAISLGDDPEVLIRDLQDRFAQAELIGGDGEFEQWLAQLGILIANRRGLRVPVTASIFEALSWAIIRQQISVSAAVTIRRRLIQLAALRHSSGLYCFPDVQRVADSSEDDLRQAGLSQNKARCLLTLSRTIASGELMLEYSGEELSVERIREQLLKIRGIGPWTVNYALLRGFGWLDGSLHGDLAVRRGLQKLLGTTDPVSEQQAQQWLAPFSPWRALIAVHLWAFLAASA